MVATNKPDDTKTSSLPDPTQPARSNEDKEYAKTVSDSSSGKMQAEVGRPDAEYTSYGLTKRPPGQQDLSEQEIRGTEPSHSRRPAK